jgi:hypothetical protein
MKNANSIPFSLLLSSLFLVCVKANAQNLPPATLSNVYIGLDIQGGNGDGNLANSGTAVAAFSSPNTFAFIDVTGNVAPGQSGAYSYEILSDTVAQIEYNYDSYQETMTLTFTTPISGTYTAVQGSGTAYGAFMLDAASVGGSSTSTNSANSSTGSSSGTSTSVTGSVTSFELPVLYQMQPAIVTFYGVNSQVYQSIVSINEGLTGINDSNLSQEEYLYRVLTGVANSPLTSCTVQLFTSATGSSAVGSLTILSSGTAEFRAIVQKTMLAAAMNYSWNAWLKSDLVEEQAIFKQAYNQEAIQEAGAIIGDSSAILPLIQDAIEAPFGGDTTTEIITSCGDLFDAVQGVNDVINIGNQRAVTKVLAEYGLNTSSSTAFVATVSQLTPANLGSFTAAFNAAADQNSPSPTANQYLNSTLTNLGASTLVLGAQSEALGLYTGDAANAIIGLGDDTSFTLTQTVAGNYFAVNVPSMAINLATTELCDDYILSQGLLLGDIIQIETPLNNDVIPEVMALAPTTESDGVLNLSIGPDLAAAMTLLSTMEEQWAGIGYNLTTYQYLGNLLNGGNNLTTFAGYAGAWSDRSLFFINMMNTATKSAGLIVSSGEETPAPTLTNISPRSGGAGTVVTLSGTNLEDATVFINNSQVGIQTNTATTIILTLPGGLPVNPALEVVTPGGTSRSVL